MVVIMHTQVVILKQRNIKRKKKKQKTRKSFVPQQRLQKWSWAKLFCVVTLAFFWWGTHSNKKLRSCFYSLNLPDTYQQKSFHQLGTPEFSLLWNPTISDIGKYLWDHQILWYMIYIDISECSAFFDEECKTFLKYDVDLLQRCHLNWRTHHQ